jgi:hypothetical protein
MLDPNTIAALGWALGWHETNNDPAVIYRLSYAGEGASGASFGRYQNDCHANPHALVCLTAVLARSFLQPAEQSRVLAAVHGHLIGAPLSVDDRAAVDAALSSYAGQALVDALDEQTIAGSLALLQRCVSAAASNGSSLSFEAMAGALIWCNASGVPTELLHYLSGGVAILGSEMVPRLAHGAIVDEAAFLVYFRMIPFVRQHPNELIRMVEAITEGTRKLAELSEG